MADFKIQQGTATLPVNDLTVTLSAGTDYTAPSAAGKAFVRVTNSCLTGGGVDGDSSGQAYEIMCWPQDTDITSSIVFERNNAATGGGDVVIAWEIIEYIGSGGGANEIKVLDIGVVALTATDAVEDGATISPTNDSDVCVFITGQGSHETTGDLTDGRHTSEWVAASNVPRFTRTATAEASDVAYAVVEFTGSNWTVNRYEHAMTALTDTDTITTVGALARTFVHNQVRTDSTGLDEQQMQVELTDTSTLTMTMETGADENHVVVNWVIENSQTDGTPMNVQRLSGTWTGGATGNPATENVAITSVDTAVAGFGCMSGSSTGSGGSTSRALVNHQITSATNAQLRKCEDGQDWTYNFEVVEWPTVAAGGGATIPFPTRRRRFQSLLAR